MSISTHGSLIMRLAHRVLDTIWYAGLLILAGVGVICALFLLQPERPISDLGIPATIRLKGEGDLLLNNPDTLKFNIPLAQGELKIEGPGPILVKIYFFSVFLGQIILSLLIVSQLRKILRHLDTGAYSLPRIGKRMQWIALLLGGIALVRSLHDTLAHYLFLDQAAHPGIYFEGGLRIAWEILIAALLVLVLAEIFIFSTATQSHAAEDV